MSYVSTDWKRYPVATVGASETNTVVSREFPITGGGSRQLVARVKTSATTVAVGITFGIQSSMDGSVWVKAAKTTAITGDGNFTLSLIAELAGDQASLPLLPRARIVVTSGAGDAVTIDNVFVVMPG